MKLMIRMIPLGLLLAYLFALPGCGAVEEAADSDAAPTRLQLRSFDIEWVNVPSDVRLHDVTDTGYGLSIALHANSRPGRPTFILYVGYNVTVDLTADCNSAIDKLGNIALTTCTPETRFPQAQVLTAAAAFTHNGKSFFLLVRRDGHEAPVDELDDFVSWFRLIRRQ